MIQYTQTLTFIQRETIFRLWNEGYPAVIAYTSTNQLDAYLDGLSDKAHYFLMNHNQIVGWACTFMRETEKWFAIIVDKSFQGKGAGSYLLNHMQEQETVLNGWVIENDVLTKPDGSAYNSPMSFYLKNGFRILNHIRLDTPQFTAVRIQWTQA